MASWGDLNSRLNRLVREGVIGGFRTNLATRPDPAGLEIVILPRAAPPDGAAEPGPVLRARVQAAIAGLAPGAKVVVADP